MAQLAQISRLSRPFRLASNARPLLGDGRSRGPGMRAKLAGRGIRWTGGLTRAVIAALLATLVLTAGRPAGAAEPLRLSEAVSLAISQHPEMQAAQAAVQRDRGYAYQAGRRPNPTFGYSAAEINQEGRAGQQGVYLSQNVPRGNKLPLDVEIGRWTVAATRAERDVTLCQIEARVSRAFVAAAAAQQRHDLLAELQQHFETAVRRTEELVAGGFVKRPVLLALQLEARRNQLAVQQQERRSDAALWQLGAAMGLQAAPAEVSTDVLQAPAPLGDLGSLWQDIAARSPQLAEVRALHQRSLWSVRRADAEPISDLQTQFTVQHDAATETPVMGVQVGVQVPVHDRNRGARSAARAETRRTHMQIHAVELQLRARLAEVLRTADVARQRLEASREQLRDLVQQNVRVTEEAYQNNEATAQEVLEAHESRIQVELEDLEAKRDLALAQVALHTCLVP